MVAGKSPEPLPPGWIEHVQVKNGRTIKYYTNGENGKKFYSRKAVINLVKTGDVNHGQNQGINNGETQSQGIGNGDGQDQGINNGDVPNQGTPKRENRRSRRSTTSPSPSSKLASKTNQSSEWLPPGWTVELKTRLTGLHNGSTYKCYISPSGRKLYSKTQVSQFLNSAANGNTPISNENKNNIEESSSNLEVPQNQTPKENQNRTSRKRKSGMDNQTPKTVSPAVAAQNISADGLPAGWIKELRTRTCPSGIRKDPYYIDPVSGYEFRSKRDVMRYLETGDIKKCVIKPKKRDESASKDIHHNIEESSSKLEVSQNHKSMENNSHISKRRKSVLDKHPAKIVSPVAVQNGSTSELPPGWIQEYKTRRLGNGIRKDPYYTDPVSGYVFRSKKDAFRYIETGDISKCAVKPTKREPGATSTDISRNTGKPSPKLKVSQNKKSMKVKRRVAKKQKSRAAKVVSNAEVQTESVDGLPAGWIREFRARRCGTKSDPYYIDPVSGYEFRSKRDALRYLETGDIAKCIMKPTKREPGSAFNDKSHNIEGSASKLEESQNNTSVEDRSNISKKRKSHPAKIAVQNSVDGLPAGWIKEIRTRTYPSGGIREDPFYIDPVSGYVFRSKKDALRYLETGDIGKCVMKPSKRVPGSTVNDISTPDTDSKKDESGSWTRRQLFVGEELKGKEGADPTDAAPTQAEEGSNKRRRSITQDFINASPGAEVNTVKTPRRRASKGSATKSRAKPTPNGDAAVASAPQSMTKTRQPRKTKAPPSLPGRSSKRLAQNKQEVETNLGLNDGGALQAGIVNSSGNEANTSLSPPSSDPAPKVVANAGFGEQAFQSAIPNSGGIDINTSWGPNDPVQKVVADLGLGEEILQGSVMNTSGIDVNTSLAPTPSNNPAQKVPQHFDANKPTTEVYHDCLGDEPLFPGKQVVGPHDDDVDMNLPLPVPNPQPQYRSGECWSDPCLDFALKTLTGGMSGENPQDHPRGAPQQQQQQQFDPPYTQGDRCFKLPVFDSSRLHPNDPSPHSGSLEKQVSGSQSPMNSPLLPPGFGLPTYSSMGSQQSGLDARKDYPPNL